MSVLVWSRRNFEPLDFYPKSEKSGLFGKLELMETALITIFQILNYLTLKGCYSQARSLRILNIKLMYLIWFIFKYTIQRWKYNKDTLDMLEPIPNISTIVEISNVFFVTLSEHESTQLKVFA